ncbi:MAG TPA: hypothetical protein DEB31_11875 [Clostridiales bacterium]|nr:hypothetical protein [Clostridiales bacterium]
MNKRFCIIANCCLLVWFFLDMFGFSIGNVTLVEAAWNDIDGIMYLIFIGLFILFCVKDRYGRYPLAVFLFLWIAMQFASHWYYTIFGATEAKIAGYNSFYANTFHVVPASDSILVPDLYHILLHALILFALICTILFCVKNRKKRTE